MAKTQPKFKKGDRVRVTTRAYTEELHGKTGTVYDNSVYGKPRAGRVYVQLDEPIGDTNHDLPESVVDLLQPHLETDHV